MSYRLTRLAAGAALLFVAAACNEDKLNVPNYNSPTVDGLSKDPNGVQLVATAMTIQQRSNINGYIRDVGTFGRELYNYFPTDGRTVSGYLLGIGTGATQRLDPVGFASGQWTGYYQNARNALNVINAANASPLTAAQKSSVSGFAKTLRALDMYYVLSTRDTIGIPVELNEDPTAAPAPFVSRDAAYVFIEGLLDQGRTELQAGGAAFPFTLHAGYAGFNTPATFLKYNRAIAARVRLVHATLGCGNTCYQAALTAVGESFAPALGAATTLAELNVGPRHVYSSAAGDALNSNNFQTNNYIFVHASNVLEAQLKADGTPDDRVTRKTVKLATPVNPPGNQNIAAEYRFDIYPTNTSPVPIIRAEELLLIRAEANWATGQTASALTDINTVRTVSGGLPALASIPAGAAGLDIIMYERRMSLIFEGHRWVDMRRWGRLAQLPLDRPTFFVAKVMPIPGGECDARPPELRPPQCGF
jgi:hypothetical protein